MNCREKVYELLHIYAVRLHSLWSLRHWFSLRENCPYSELFWSVFSHIGLTTERYSVSHQVQSEWGKIRTRITPNTYSFYALFISSGCLARHKYTIFTEAARLMVLTAICSGVLLLFMSFVPWCKMIVFGGECLVNIL